MKFRKKPVVIDAIRASEVLDGATAGRFSPSTLRDDQELMPDWIIDAFQRMVIGFELSAVLINTLEGQMRAERTDWIIRGVAGELYPCKPDIFDKTYERVDGPARSPTEIREVAVELARKCAKAKPQSYYVEPFEPHEWVIDAILEAIGANQPTVFVRDANIAVEGCTRPCCAERPAARMAKELELKGAIEDVRRAVACLALEVSPSVQDAVRERVERVIALALAVPPQGVAPRQG